MQVESFLILWWSECSYRDTVNFLFFLCIPMVIWIWFLTIKSFDVWNTTYLPILHRENIFYVCMNCCLCNLVWGILNNFTSHIFILIFSQDPGLTMTVELIKNIWIKSALVNYLNLLRTYLTLKIIGIICIVSLTLSQNYSCVKLDFRQIIKIQSAVCLFNN